MAGLDQADILEIVDHHRLADIETTNPIYVRNEPVGSPPPSWRICIRKGTDAHSENGGPYGFRHRLRHGHVQVSHLHVAGH